MKKYVKIVPKIYGCVLYTTVSQKTSADSKLVKHSYETW